MKRLAVISIFFIFVSPLFSQSITIDNDYADWRDVDLVASFSPGFSPMTFQQTRAGSPREREIADSFYWGKAGTRVANLKGLVSRGNAYLMLETRDGIVPGTSYYLYAYEHRGQERASATVEIAVTGGTNGFVFLWLPDQDEPRVVGEFVHDRFYLEAQADFSRLPETVRDALSSDVAETLTFDFSAAFSGARVHEEFFYTTVYARDIVHQGPPGL